LESTKCSQELVNKNLGILPTVFLFLNFMTFKLYLTVLTVNNVNQLIPTLLNFYLLIYKLDHRFTWCDIVKVLGGKKMFSGKTKDIKILKMAQVGMLTKSSK